MRPLPGAARPADTTGEPAPVPGAKDAGRDASFPTSYAQFAINPKTQRLSIKIVDAATDEVIREIPPEQVERIAEDLASLSHPFGKHASGGGAVGVGSTGGGVDRYV